MPEVFSLARGEERQKRVVLVGDAVKSVLYKERTQQHAELYLLNTTLVLLHSLFVQLRREVCLFYCPKMTGCASSWPLLKKHTFSIKVNNVTKQLESSRTLRGSLAFAKISVVISRIFLFKLTYLK